MRSADIIARQEGFAPVLDPEQVDPRHTGPGAAHLAERPHLVALGDHPHDGAANPAALLGGIGLDRRLRVRGNDRKEAVAEVRQIGVLDIVLGDDRP